MRFIFKLSSERERKATDKWHLDEMNIKIKGEVFILWRAVDSKGHELEILLQKRRNKKSAIRFYQDYWVIIQLQE
ncbi:MAG: DDE-type integrase/transposase/recombinase [Rickettsia hoogstraalii]